MLKTFIGVLALAATLPAAAAPSRVVQYGDLDLTRAAGMERLERRIDAAARSVCNVGSGRVIGVSEYAQGRACIAEAKAKAAQQVAQLETRNARGG